MPGRFIGAPSFRPTAGASSVSARLGEPALAHAVGRIYDAAIGQYEWLSVLGGLSAMLGGTTAVLHHFRSPQRQAASTAVNTDPVNIELYDSHYHKTEPKLAVLPMLPGDGVFIDHALLSEAAVVRTEHYNDFLRPQDVHSCINWFEVGPQGVPQAGVSIWRPRHREGWGGREVRVLRHLSGHLRRALRVERRLAEIAPRRPQPRVELTRREQDCLSWVARGASSKEAARRLELSVYTVNEYVGSAMRKLGAVTRTEAVAMSLAQGLIEG
ncbi:response regulator transcription factor [Inquilinus sp.]|uniref:response regulator transcription factor n=1 Tax=Inquilinus sp. TaxID=1932117 RepID=UPI003784AAA7